MKSSFPKSERLTGRNDIARLFQDGESIFSHPYKLVYLSAESADQSRFLVTVPKRNFKSAVKRNLLKRRTREAYRLNKHLISDKKYDLAFIYIAKDVLSFSTIEKKLLELLHRLK